MENVIIVDGLGKQYRSYHHARPYTIMAAVLSGWRYLQPKERYWALQDLSFQVAPGEMLGVIGRNGAGKSTLLKVMGGLLATDRGKVRIKGRIGSLLTLGSGFHPDLTGRENALVNGIVAGLTRREMVRCMSQVIEFAELEDAIDSPVRTYSTGMTMRLAFSVAVHSNPDVMLVDEFLSVGDKAFQSKCLARIDRLKAGGTAIVLVSHNVEQIAQMCDRTLWLRQGRVYDYGDSQQIVEQYLEVMNADSAPTYSGNKEAVIDRVEVLNHEGESVSTINSGDGLTVAIDYHYTPLVTQCKIQVSIIDRHQHTCFESAITVRRKTNSVSRQQLNIDRLDLSSGQYQINVELSSADGRQIYDRFAEVFLTVETPVETMGSLAPPHQWYSDSIVLNSVQE